MVGQVNKLQAKYEAAKRESEILRLNVEKDALRARQRSILLGGLSFLLIASALVYGYYQRKQRQKVLLKAEKDHALEKEKIANQQLSDKSKELTTNILQLAEKNKQLHSFREELLQISRMSQKEPKLLVDRLARKVDMTIDDNQLWSRLTEEFKVVHSDFLAKLGQEDTSFSKAEIRLIALMKMNLSSKEIAQVLHITDEGVKKARQRLRKKLAIESSQNLQEHLLNI